MSMSSITLRLSVKLLYSGLILLAATPAAARIFGSSPAQPSAIKKDLSQPLQKDSKPILNYSDYLRRFDSSYKSQPQGPRTGGGGNTCALAIIRQTESLLDTVKTLSLLTEDDSKKLLAAVRNAQFFFTPHLELNGEAKDAINYPHQNSIYVTESFCKKLDSIISPTIMALLFHEYLGLARIDDRDYSYSQRLVKQYYEEDEKIREGTNEFGWFAGDVPAEPIRNEREITLKQAKCGQVALNFAKSIYATKGVKNPKPHVFSITASEQYSAAADTFHEIEYYYITRHGGLGLSFIASEGCLMQSIIRVDE